jgi:hypothetical protein
MLTFSQNKQTNDIETVVGANGKGHISFVTDKESFANIISDALRTLQGELQLDVEAGIPYLETIFESNNNIELWKHRVREVVDGFDFVESIDSFTTEWDVSKNLLKYNLRITTTKGEVEVSNER